MKKMKVLLLVVALLTISTTLFSQINTEIYRHEFRVSVGMPSNIYTDYDYDYYYDNYYQQAYNSKTKVVPNININYTYQFYRWLSVGLNVSYNQSSMMKSYIINDTESKVNRDFYYLNFTPMVRFNWLNHGMASLYSSVGIGVQYQYVKKYEQNPNRLNKFYNINPAFDLVGLGLRVGTNFFGFCEIGYGNCGIVKAGVGYRFNTKENQ